MRAVEQPSWMVYIDTGATRMTSYVGIARSSQTTLPSCKTRGVSEKCLSRPPQGWRMCLSCTRQVSTSDWYRLASAPRDSTQNAVVGARGEPANSISPEPLLTPCPMPAVRSRHSCTSSFGTIAVYKRRGAGIPIGPFAADLGNDDVLRRRIQVSERKVRKRCGPECIVDLVHCLSPESGVTRPLCPNQEQESEGAMVQPRPAPNRS